MFQTKLLPAMLKVWTVALNLVLRGNARDVLHKILETEQQHNSTLVVHLEKRYHTKWFDRNTRKMQCFWNVRIQSHFKRDFPSYKLA